MFSCFSVLNSLSKGSLPKQLPALGQQIKNTRRYQSSKAANNIKEIVINQLKQLPISNNGSTCLIKQQKPTIITPFISKNRAAQHTLNLYDKLGISRDQQDHCYTAHAASRFGTLQSLLDATALYQQHGYRWIGYTPAIDASEEAHVYDLNVNGEKAIAVALTFDPELLSTEARKELKDNNYPVIKDIFLSALVDPPLSIKQALAQIPSPTSAEELYSPTKLPSSIKSVLEQNHYTANMVHVAEEYGLGGYNHLSERFQDLPELEEMSIDDHYNWWTSSADDKIAINNTPHKHWRIHQWSTKSEGPMYSEFEWRLKNYDLGMQLKSLGRLDDVVFKLLEAKEKYVPGFNFEGASTIVNSTNHH
ncbi:hypothetical protein DID75_03080 [Candidatus Marinamargulisbacteria bacterium SCGC AG-410-N11]|nr:hypothetical protein DID75_03080 [Candidatus Marinamargulisbacteria bacterium SCGC AG-410-N11]